MALWQGRRVLPALRPQRADFFWLSFVDPAREAGQRLLGCTVVKATDMAGAVRTARRLGINPGGDVHGYAIEDDGTLDADRLAYMLNSLRSYGELERLGVI